MGEALDYTLSMSWFNEATRKPLDETVDDDTFNDVLRDIRVDLDELEYLDKQGQGGDNHWDYTTDLIAASQRHPAIVFQLDFDSSWDDKWTEYFFRGKHQRAEETCVVDEFDEDSLEEGNNET